MRITLLAFLGFFVACNSNQSSETSTAPKSDTVATETKPAPETSSTANSVDENSVAEIDADGVLLKLHQLIKFEPRGNAFLKVDNSKYDYYVMDVSLTNNTSSTVDGGKIAFGIDIEGKDGSRFQKIDPSVKALSLYDMEVNKKDQKAYDKFWGKINAGDKARTLVKGFEVPRNVQPLKFVYEDAGKGTKKEAPIK